MHVAGFSNHSAIFYHRNFLRDCAQGDLRFVEFERLEKTVISSTFLGAITQGKESIPITRIFNSYGSSIVVRRSYSTGNCCRTASPEGLGRGLAFVHFDTTHPAAEDASLQFV
jgi:hypothetical protein